ncbi:hypothetical protein D9613_002689 [Agrocybe pediades]|uniref:ubiquitinyl hydrolase 1 n=1 Tax=Agrocybe pediades TaxID=84607 RepID=A0A8H4QP80_9AGAR|nr:hypothetical protein D9613_002689 [Agrocybe pediades]
MPPKRKRTPFVPEKNSCLKASPSNAPWGWVGTEVHHAEDMTLEHLKSTCNISARNNNACCSNIYLHSSTPKQMPPPTTINGELRDDVIVISDEEDGSCSKKDCRTNPFCLNYLGQDKLEEVDMKGTASVRKLLGDDPSTLSRQPRLPVGLKVWYRDLAFRAGVYACQPPSGTAEGRYKDSPISQLQITFAALQDGNVSSFNPEKLVESLQLRRTEQQDAQEFSKLFMSHLDNEFKKQSNPSVQSLIKNQFQGSQVYGTVCHGCKNRSERSSDFLEIELSIEKNSTLEDKLASALAPELLNRDNQYFCSRCESLQDATRYTELRKLPPVLHFSLLRFVYDVSTMVRKKSKHSITFPLLLDMKKFIGSLASREAHETNDLSDESYELRGILLHKGTSAYHGHYEAQVYDAQYGAWFQFNDETVTEIKTLGDKLPPKKPIVQEITEMLDDDDDDAQPDSSEVRQKRANSRKRRRIDDSDDDVVEISVEKTQTSTKVHVKQSNPTSIIKSKDAYMLIYARKSRQEQIQNSERIVADKSPPSAIPQPPARAKEIVLDMNKAHDAACRDFLERSKRIEVKLTHLQKRIKEVYSTWTSHAAGQESVVVSRQALESWLSQKGIEAGLREITPDQTIQAPSPDSPADMPPPLIISTSDIVCEHGRLDPLKSRDMKCLSQDSLEMILSTGCTFEPILRTSDPCNVCAAYLFREKLYEYEHAKYTNEFDAICACDENEEGYWISKKWCKDWKLVKPRMHVCAEDDPAPDSEEFGGQVYCEHGGLTLQTTGRRKISHDAVQLLQKLFPNWRPPSTNTETCAVCDAEVHISKEDKKEVRKRVEDEKARLSFISQSSLDAWAELGDFAPCAVLPTQFIREWKRWISSPFDNPRPGLVDNNRFICQHDHLLFDPNCHSDMESVITVVKKDEWDVLQSLYDAGPFIGLTKRPGLDEKEYDHDIPVCDECRMRSKREWQSAEIFLRLCGPGSEGSTKDVVQAKSSQTYSRLNGGARQSKRLRQMKNHGERRKIEITKSTTVKDIKIMASKEFNVPTICQRLFYKGRELQDNEATVESLQILVNDVIDMREATEVLEIDSDTEDGQLQVKRRRTEGAGFGGTLLGSAEASWTSSPDITPLPMLSDTNAKACSACTYLNKPDYLRCEICSTILL